MALFLFVMLLIHLMAYEAVDSFDCSCSNFSPRYGCWDSDGSRVVLLC